MGQRYRNLWRQAQTLMPGGVNSPVRAFKAVGMNPLIVSRAKGSFIYDLDGKRFIDLVMSWGPFILGHAHPQVVQSVKDAAERGFSYGALSEGEIQLAKIIKEAIGSIEKIRFVNSGTEAVMTAIRLARAFTHRDLIVKFEGCYHGHSDAMLSRAGSGLATYGLSGSAGVPQNVAKSTVVLPFNDCDAVEKAFARHSRKIAAVLLEPIPANMGVLLPREGYLEFLRKITRQYESLLIFDEVITGFRVSFAGAQGFYAIKPDLTLLGKIIGGGFPVGALGGRREIMDLLAPLGPVYQAGTLSGNPVAMAAGFKTLEILKKKNLYAELEQKGRQLEEGLGDILRKKNISATLHRVGSMLTLFFSSRPLLNYQDVQKSKSHEYVKLFKKMYRSGIFLPPSAFEAWFLSTAHTHSDLENVIRNFEKSI